MKMSIQVKGKNQYFAAHGRMPRGRGSWAFQIGSKITERNEIFWTQCMTFTDAVKEAKAEAKRLGEFTITVLT